MKRILFVCTGNTCRSPMAEAILKQKLKWAGIRGVVVSSAGIQAEEGEKMSPNAFLALKQLGIVNYAFRSRRLTEKMMARSDLVIVMTERQWDLLCDWPNVRTRRKSPEAAISPILSAGLWKTISIFRMRWNAFATYCCKK